MRSFKALYDKGMVAIVQGVGYPNPGPLAFPLDRDLADGCAGSLRAHRLAWTILRRCRTSAPRISSKASRVSRVLPEALVSERTDIPAIPGLGDYALIADQQSHRDAAPSARQAHDASCRSDRRIWRTSWRSRATRSAAPKSCPSSSPDTRRRPPIRQPASGAAWP